MAHHDVRQKSMSTLRISAALALIVSLSIAYAATQVDQLYAELLRGAPLPALTNLVLWRYGLLYWMAVPLVILALYLSGCRLESKRQRFAEGIMFVGTASTLLFMVGSILPLTTITIYLKE
jgi:hypothetical protein